MITKGEDAYKHGNYQEAARQFTRAVELEPANLNARLLLAETLLTQYVPGTDAVASRLGNAARQQYLDVLTRDPSNKRALHGMLSLSLNARQFAEAHERALKAIQADATDKLAYYTAAFADWAIAWPEYAGARQAAGMQAQTPGIIPDADLRESVRTQHMAQIEDGIHMLDTALQLDPDYSDAMDYLSHLYRMEAALADGEVQSADLTAQANHWATQALESERTRVRIPPAAALEADASGAVSEFAPPPPPRSAPPPPPGWHGTLPAPLLAGGTTPPPIPEVAKTGASGLVQLSVIIAKDGTVRDVRVLSGTPVLATPIVKGVRNWVFERTMVNSTPVEVTTVLTFRIKSRGE